jgi:hypothetical protein
MKTFCFGIHIVN